MSAKLTYDEMVEAWEETKNSGGKYLTIAKYGGLFGMECKGVQLKWMPFKKPHIWSAEVNIWRNEMEDQYSEN